MEALGFRSCERRVGVEADASGEPQAWIRRGVDEGVYGTDPVGSSAIPRVVQEVAAGIPAGRVDSVVVLPFPARVRRGATWADDDTLLSRPTHRRIHPSRRRWAGGGVVASEPV